MEIHFKIIGVILIALSGLHALFPKYFDWINELRALRLINRQMMYVHTFFIALIVFLMGLLCLTSSTDFTQSDFGRKIAFGLGLFWMIRLFIQFFGYSSKLWKGKTFETVVHILLSLLWTYMSSVFMLTSLGTP
jgi:hypothetical protein